LQHLALFFAKAAELLWIVQPIQKLAGNLRGLDLNVLEVREKGLIKGVKFADVFDADASGQAIEAVQGRLMQA
jgi:hypothetical protein